MDAMEEALPNLGGASNTRADRTLRHDLGGSGASLNRQKIRTITRHFTDSGHHPICHHFCILIERENQ